MPDLSCNIAGIKSPNPFWLASGPPTNTAYQVRRAFDAGWGGAVWKTVTDDPIVNVSSRYAGISLNNRRLIGLNNIELISDRSLDDNLRDMAEVKRRHSQHALIASVMVESKRDTWQRVIRQIQDIGIDGFELNFGCPHGMNERGMGSAVGQVPEYTEMICGWVKEVSTVPILVKLTPNVTDIVQLALAAKRGGTDGISVINTVNSVMGLDLDSMSPRPDVGGVGSAGGYSGPAVKPIALYMVSQLARHRELGLPISGVGGIRKWEDCAEFLLVGATSLQVCTAVMTRGFGIIRAMSRGLERWMSQKGFENLNQIVGLSTPRIKPWGELDLNYKVVADIDESTCIHCGICYASCEDGCYQAINVQEVSKPVYLSRFGEPARPKGEAAPAMGFERTTGTIDVFTVNLEACVGCNMCALACPVEECITMKEIPSGKPPMNWDQYQQLLQSNQIQPLSKKDTMIYWILIADAAHARIFSTTARNAPLKLEREIENPAGRARAQELVSDEPGRLRKGGSSGTLSATDPRTSAHDVEADRFVRELASTLEHEADRGTYAAIAIVAPPQFLGRLREAMGTKVHARLRGSLPKDLTKIAVAALPAHLAELFEPGAFLT